MNLLGLPVGSRYTGPVSTIHLYSALNSAPPSRSWMSSGFASATGTSCTCTACHACSHTFAGQQNICHPPYWHMRSFHPPHVVQAPVLLPSFLHAEFCAPDGMVGQCTDFPPHSLPSWVSHPGLLTVVPAPLMSISFCRPLSTDTSRSISSCGSPSMLSNSNATT